MIASIARSVTKLFESCCFHHLPIIPGIFNTQSSLSTDSQGFSSRELWLELPAAITPRPVATLYTLSTRFLKSCFPRAVANLHYVSLHNPRS